LRVLNPATEQPIAELQAAGMEETDRAVAAARAALPGWRAVKPADRARLLRRLAALVEEHGEELARLETLNAGKPIADSRGEMAMVAAVFHYCSGAVERLYGETIPVAGGVDMTFREPLGVVGLIVPWNFPLLLASWKLGPALACANTVVLKPAELTPLTALRLAELALEAGLPEGVLNVVVGPGSVCGDRLVRHPDVAKIGFTGSTEVGRRVMEGAAATIKRVTLELGGKSANLVFEDADLERAAAAAPSAVFGNAGQDCCARSRILVQRSVYDRFLGLLVEATGKVRVGDPEDPATEMGPLISADQRSKVALLRRAGTDIPGRGPGRPGVLVPLHADRGRQHRPRRPGGGVRPCGGRDPVRERGRRGPHRQRLSVRPPRFGLDPRRSPRAPCGARSGNGDSVGQLEHLGASGDALRRLQTVGAGA